jgi:hypothetical protein
MGQSNLKTCLGRTRNAIVVKLHGSKSIEQSPAKKKNYSYSYFF